MVAPGVSEMMEMALLPLFWMVGVATWVMVRVATSDVRYPALVAMALTVVAALIVKGLGVLCELSVGVPPFVV